MKTNFDEYPRIEAYLKMNDQYRVVVEFDPIGWSKVLTSARYRVMLYPPVGDLVGGSGPTLGFAMRDLEINLKRVWRT